MDRRVIKTKRAIKSAFLKLLSEKDLNDITIKEIAETADVNRKTFYNYYSGIHELIAEIEDDVLSSFDELVEGLTVGDIVNEPSKLLIRLNDLVQENTEFVKFAVDGNSNIALFERLSKTFSDKVRNTLITNEKDNIEELPIVFILSGITGAYSWWFRSEEKPYSLDELSQKLGKICDHGVEGFVR